MLRPTRCHLTLINNLNYLIEHKAKSNFTILKPVMASYVSFYPVYNLVYNNIDIIQKQFDA